MSKVTRRDLFESKRRGRPIVVVTAYDVWSARLADRAGVDVILVGDSLGMVVQGHDSTLPVSLEHMVYHTACVSRARPRAMVVADLPFGTFQRGPATTLDASIRLVQEGSAEAVKIEGAGERLRSIETVAQADIPVWAHLGLTPQSVHAFGGFRVQGRSEDAATRLIDAARRVESAGASALVLECIPADLAREIRSLLSIPTIGIGAGPHCDGQVLVFHDLLGLGEEFRPRFVRRYAELGTSIEEALRSFAQDVRGGRFPGPEHSYGSPPSSAPTEDEESGEF
jgi:3-methyl-2-oxobutanoate hydroxymethyltransferase